MLYFARNDDFFCRKTIGSSLRGGTKSRQSNPLKLCISLFTHHTLEKCVSIPYIGTTHKRPHSHKARPARHAKAAHPKAKPARHTKAARSKVRPTRHTKANSRAGSLSKKQRISQRKAAHKPLRNRRAARRSR